MLDRLVDLDFASLHVYMWDCFLVTSNCILGK
jgi:hypothetical protein